ncbi:MAG: ATPase [Chitinophaga sp.]|jgi:uncharacterized protein YndB with AHSA1/START domain|nr:ATPase [Chitinophaga sp.]
MMKTTYNVNKEQQTVTVERTFAADKDLVWDAFTTAEILDEWWAPKPFKSRTKAMDFKVGGRRFYAMVSPEGNEMWSIQKYISISPKDHFKILSAFADENENPQLPGSEWSLNFTEESGTTKVTIVIFNESLERMEKMIAMGFKEGFAMAHDNLDEYLASKK